MSISIGISNAIGMAKSGPAAYSNLYSIEFDGTDDFLTSSSVPSIGTGDFSINFWVYRLADSGADEYIMFSDATTDWKIYINGSNDRMRWVSTAWSDISSGTVAVGAWEMWTFAVDRGTASRWYRNAVVLDSKTIGDSTDFSAGASAFTIGRDNGTTFNFNGRLDECSVWDKELSGSEITALYNSGEPTDLSAESFASNLIHWWRMGDPSGEDSYSTIADAEGSLNMTMTNMTRGDINTNVPS